MALDQISDKLDQLTSSELGVQFDEAALWNRLESKFDQHKRYISPWWAAVACVVLFTCWPIVFLNKTARVQVAQVKEVAPPPVIEKPVLKEVKTRQGQVVLHPTHKVKPKSIEITLAGLVVKPVLNPIEIAKKQPKQLFAAEDISIIQASLEQSRVENGRTMTIRAQWQKSPAKSNVEYQALKIKLYDKQE